MKFLKLDGTMGECTPYAANFDELRHQVDGEWCYVLPPIPADAHLDQVVASAMSIIAMKPPYLPESEIPWILAYMDGLIAFAMTNDEDAGYHFYGKGKVARYTLSGTYGSRYDDEVQRPNFIELTRRFTAVELILIHLYGKRFYSRRSRPGKPERPACPYIVGMRDDLSSSYESHPWFDRRCLDFMNNRRFKTEMTQGYFKGARGAFVIPAGMQFKFQTNNGAEIIRAGACAPFEIDRFFATRGGWPDSYQLVGFPELADESSISTLDLIPTLRSSLGKSTFYRSEPMLELPLSWITHIIRAPLLPTIQQISVQNVCDHNYPATVDTSLNESIRTKVYGQAVKEANEMNEAMRNCDLDATFRPSRKD